MSKSKVYTACTARWPFTDLSLYTDWLIQKTDGHAYLFVLPVDEGEFELELCGVDGEDPGSDLPIQTENAVPLDPGDVDGQVQGTDDAVVTEERQTWISVNIVYLYLKFMQGMPAFKEYNHEAEFLVVCHLFCM